MCKVTLGKSPAEWEEKQFQEFGPTQQLSCNPASTTTGFPIAAGQCPLAFRAHFPCIDDRFDYEFCTGARGGMDVKKDKVIVPFHELCMGHDMFRRVFECVDPKPHQPGTNLVMYALEWKKDHPRMHMPYNVINWKMGTPVGVWGGDCTW